MCAYLRREVTLDLDGKRIRSHVTVWQNGARLLDVALVDNPVEVMAEVATRVLSVSFLVGAFVPPPYPDENLDWRAELAPLDLPAQRDRLFLEMDAAAVRVKDGSGTEAEYREAFARWEAAARRLFPLRREFPWNPAPASTVDPAVDYLGRSTDVCAPRGREM
jgi:hypothetical protein